MPPVPVERFSAMSLHQYSPEAHLPQNAETHHFQNPSALAQPSAPGVSQDRQPLLPPFPPQQPQYHPPAQAMPDQQLGVSELKAPFTPHMPPVPPTQGATQFSVQPGSGITPLYPQNLPDYSGVSSPVYRHLVSCGPYALGYKSSEVNLVFFVPSNKQVIESNRAQYSGPFPTGQRGVVPPLVSTEFSCRDEGNCNPRFIRSSLYAIPTSSDLLKTVGIPFTLTISPFAAPHPDDQPILVSDMGEQGPVRCVRCRAYMSPFVCFLDGGRRFQCPLCNGLTEVPTTYFAHLDHTGRRTDTYHRPELCLGSYELMATAEYCKNNELPKPPVFIFLLDVSQASIRSGLVQLFCSQFVERILPNLPKDETGPEGAQSPLKVGFITYDHQLHFYSLIRDSSVSTGNDNIVVNGKSGTNFHVQPLDYAKPQMHIVADVEDVFVPALEGFLIPPDPASIDSLLRLVPAQFGAADPATSAADALLGPAIQAGLEALRAANCPGKLFVFHSNLPSAEAPGKLKNRDDRRLIGTDKEKSLLTPAVEFYTGLGQVCVEAGCSVDLFLFPNAYTDVATLAEVPRLTAGHLYKYNCFQADLQGDHFMADLERAVARPKAFNAVMRVRTSAGIRPVEFFGNCQLPNTTDIELACVDPHMAVTVEIRHDDKLQDKDAAFIQAACLYTSLSGQRKLRIHNLSLATTSSIPEVFRICELDTHLNWLCKWSMRALCSRAHPHVMDELTTRTAHMLTAYRRHCSGGPGDTGAGPGELVLPQNMKLYPLYVQCLMKTDAFMPADNVSIDERAWLMFLVNGMDVKQSGAYLYPRIYPVHNLTLNPDGQIVYPPSAIRCSYEWLQPDGAYLLNNGINLFLWIGTNLPAEWIQAVFNVASARHFEPERLIVVRPGDKLESCFKRFLVEDRHSGNTVSYVEYLCHIHKEVCSLLR
ncbi:protein transport protein SEC24 [Paragonimus westermani]|uniref:Protein transport protein SEC24 n=1 Tax=Paragonimus westermani TaxID=34504 RepID=A0A5J4NBH9_9TREM|nr:protein transport protein SEC24 [Paragonimus westermani]